MFASIARRYDLLNHLLSLNLDRRWRRLAARRAVEGLKQPRVLDLCAGTGDLALEVARQCPEATVVALDFAGPMLERARSKFRRATSPNRLLPLCGDALRLPFRDHSFDALATAFGLRNVSPVEQALTEAARVLRPGGRFVVLEFAMPERGWWRAIYSFYFFRVLPKIGRWISGTSAYSYLPASVALFLEPERLGERLGRQRFINVRRQPLLGGAVAIHTATLA
jgi:demethylmenaquinone methyltransferase/2-methoxy-6-polyprenyl-1,4-benzoquinol methylase